MVERGGSLTLVCPQHARRVKRVLFAGAMALSLAPLAAQALPRESPLPPLPAHSTATHAPAPPPADDGLRGGGFYLEANELIEDDTHHTITARGAVEARYQDRVLRADQLVYNSTTGVVTATGQVTIINPDGTAEFSQSAVLDRQLSEGVAIAFSTRLQDNVTIASASVVRPTPDVSKLDHAIFTACPVCAKQPTPTWSIRARQVVEDKKHHIISFHDAVILVRGLPVFYVPLIWEPGPEVKRQSGLLIPDVNISSLRGLSYEQPYLQVLSPSADMVVSPQINTKVNPFLNFDYRERFYSGAIDVRAGYTYEQDFNSEGDKLGNATSRSYILAKGLFAISDDWDWGFTAERASDPLIFDRYAVPDPFVERGLYAADDRRLISQLYTTRQTQDSYLSVAAIDVQGLRSTDLNGTFPAVAPLIEARYEPQDPIFGGRLRIDGSGVVLDRDESPIDPNLPGVDSRRGTLEANWQRTFIFPNGMRLDPFLDARADIYSLDEQPAPGPKNPVIARSLETAGATLTWPFVKRDGSWTYVVEPVAQIAISPTLRQDPRIPNEDSVDFSFDETNLFQVDKSSGFDLIDSGQRLNVGLRGTLQTDGGENASLLIGRSFRAEPDPNLPAQSGLSSTQSDWVIAASATPIKDLDFFVRSRLDTGSLNLNYLEFGSDFRLPRVDGQIRYLQEAQDATGQKVQDLDFHGEVFVTKHWGVTAYGAREFTTGVWRQEDFGIVYKDDCIRVEILYRRDNTFNGVLGPSQGIGFRLSLATLGNSGYAADSSPTVP
jgi:LPS-assembly protein